LAKAGRTEDKSAVNRYWAASGLDGILLGSCQLPCTFNYLFMIDSGLDKQQFQAFNKYSFVSGHCNGRTLTNPNSLTIQIQNL